LRTYQQAVARYHLHPEAKFSGGDYTQAGMLGRRHLRVPDVNGIEYIGKEANRWEERSQTGEDTEAQITYGAAGGSLAELRATVQEACARYGLRALAREAGLSAHAVSDLVSGSGETSDATIATLQAALSRLSNLHAEAKVHERTVLELVRQQCKRTGVSRFAAQAGVDRATLQAVLGGRRRLSQQLLKKLGMVVQVDVIEQQQG
jgi:plasmid maintenance system antidote protein VapI